MGDVMQRTMLEWQIGVELEQARTFLRSAKISAQTGDKYIARHYAMLAVVHLKRAFALERSNDHV